MGFIADKIQKDAEAGAMTTADMGGAGQAPLTVDQGRRVKRMPAKSGACKDCGKEPCACVKKDAGCTDCGERAARFAKDAADVPNIPGKTNWVEEAGGLPRAIADVAGDLITERGMTTSRAIATAVSRAKVWCAKGNAKYCAAVTEWEAKRARAHVTKAYDTDETVAQVMEHGEREGP